MKSEFLLIFQIIPYFLSELKVSRKNVLQIISSKLHKCSAIHTVFCNNTNKVLVISPKHVSDNNYILQIPSCTRLINRCTLCLSDQRWLHKFCQLRWLPIVL